MGFFKKKKKKISKELFGERVLSRMLLISAQKSPDLFEEFGISMEFTHYLFYLEYLLFLAEKILAQKYSSEDVMTITDSTINGMVDFMDAVPLEKKNEVKKLFREMYVDFATNSEKICADISSKQGLKNLSDSFLLGLGMEKGMLENVRVFTELSGFVVYHTSDILNDEIVLV